MELKESRKRHEKRRVVVVGTKVSRNDDLIVREEERVEEDQRSTHRLLFDGDGVWIGGKLKEKKSSQTSDSLA